FNSAEGEEFVRKVLKPLLPFDPHDYQIEGVCKLLDGWDLVAVTPTSSGKTGFFYMFLLVVLAITKTPSLSPDTGPSRFPKNPVLVVVCPTIYLMAQLVYMTGLNITHVVINSITTKLQREADASRVQSLWMTARESVSMIILGPEMLISGGFRLLLGFPDFLAWLCGIGVDEIHVLLSWGVGFRDAFTRIGYIREQLLDSVPLIGVTATLRVTDGVEQSVLNFLSVKHDQAHFIWRSNARYNIQYLRRTLYSGIGGDDFPELLWLLSIPSSEKVVIFCASINLGFRVKKYLNCVWTSSTDADQAIRMYNALNDDDHNTKTRDMAQHLALCYIIIATTTIALGANIMGIAYIVMIGPPESSDMFLQMAGRLDRKNTVVQPRVILYVSEAHQELARKIL
ncbi:P-loop containing nucleoside triphosphate hydrolase protein, partial [Mucidula mucida]